MILRRQYTMKKDNDAWVLYFYEGDAYLFTKRFATDEELEKAMPDYWKDGWTRAYTTEEYKEIVSMRDGLNLIIKNMEDNLLVPQF